MIGDHFQLPPTIKSLEASEKGMSVSLFSRLVNEVGLDVSMLDIQYRMVRHNSPFSPT
jgi:ATP-dependent RNA/DNA helicase IGHMBP2